MILQNAFDSNCEIKFTFFKVFSAVWNTSFQDLNPFLKCSTSLSHRLIRILESEKNHIGLVVESMVCVTILFCQLLKMYVFMMHYQEVTNLMFTSWHNIPFIIHFCIYFCPSATELLRLHHHMRTKAIKNPICVYGSVGNYKPSEIFQFAIFPHF